MHDSLREIQIPSFACLATLLASCRKSLLIETAPGARNTAPALGKEPPGNDRSSHSPVTKKSKENRLPFLNTPSEKRAVGRVISENDADDKRTGKVHKTSTAPTESDGIRSSSPGKRIRGVKDEGGGGGPRGVAPPSSHELNEHTPPSGGAPRSRDGGDAGGSKVTVICPKSSPLCSQLKVEKLDPSAFRQKRTAPLFRYFVLTVIVLFVVGLVVERLAERVVSHRDPNGSGASGGYQALRGDNAATTAAAVSVSGQQRQAAASAGGNGDHVEDDDAVVVTGLPVNPPPAVDL